MEILNKNQRDSALWRLFGLGVIALGVSVTSVVFMHQEYAGKGLDDLNQCNERIQQLKSQLQNEEAQLKFCRDSLQEANKPDNEKKTILKAKIEQETKNKEHYKSQYDIVKADLIRCEDQKKEAQQN
jgi:hypothetical protein